MVTERIIDLREYHTASPKGKAFLYRNTSPIRTLRRQTKFPVALHQQFDVIAKQQSHKKRSLRIKPKRRRGGMHYDTLGERC